MEPQARSYLLRLLQIGFQMIQKLRTFLLATALVLPAFASGVRAQTTSESDARVVAMEEMRKSAEITGWSITAIKDGDVAHQFTGGTRSSETNPPIDAESIFDAESLTKPVTAYIALKMAGEGKLDLDRPLSEYAPYPDASGDNRYLKITARMVLNHTGGFPNWRNGGDVLPILFEPGQIFSYSGEGYVFLQKTLEAITLKSLEELAKAHVFDPLGMTSSSLVWQKAFQSGIAVGHTDMGVALDKFTPTQPNGAYGMHTTASDYARFLLAAQQGEGLDSDIHKQMSTAAVDAGDGIYWGLGWGLQPTLNGMALWHWGDNPGYKSFAYITPDGSNGFVLLSNSANGMLALHQVFEHLVGGPQTAVKWLNYERFDDPTYVLGRRLHYAYLAGGMDRVRMTYLSSRDDLPEEAYDESTLNSLGYRFLRQGMLEPALALFQFNVELYPGSSNVHDSLGEGYFSLGRLEEALASYRTSLRLDPLNQNGTAMIEQIQAQIDAGN